jgi:hypothetical protein
LLVWSNSCEVKQFLGPGVAVFEVYLNGRRDLLVVEKGHPLPPMAASGKWRKRKKKVVRVSCEISSEVKTRGYYFRKVSDLKSHRAV